VIANQSKLLPFIMRLSLPNGSGINGTGWPVLPASVVPAASPG